MASEGLRVEKVSSGYGGSEVLFDIDLAVAPGQVVSLVGRNGMGKSTLVKTVMGELTARKGHIYFNGRNITAAKTHRIAQSGIGWVPEGSRIFAGLTVFENLMATARKSKSNGWSLQQVYALFPRLAERRDLAGWQLSGGEQQMLAIARALMTNPHMLILDEATEGLAPLIRAEIWRVLRQLKSAGQSILIIDKNLKALAALADRHYVFERGRVVWSGTSDDLMSDRHQIQHWVSV